MRILAGCLQAITTTMQDCFQIRTSKELIDYLKTNENIDAYDDFSYQVQTNYWFVYNLKSGQVVFIPNNFRGDGLLFQNENNQLRFQADSWKIPHQPKAFFVMHNCQLSLHSYYKKTVINHSYE